MVYECLFFVILSEIKHFDMISEVKNAVIGGVGIGAVEVATPVLQSADVSSIVQIVVQVVIGIATLVSMFRKNKGNPKN